MNRAARSTTSTYLRRIAALLVAMTFALIPTLPSHAQIPNAEPIHLVKDLNQTNVGVASPTNLLAIGNILYFVQEIEPYGRELWRSDGTSAGTWLVKDIHPGLIDSIPAWLTNVNGTLYFTAVNDVIGIELWKSDGTAAGTVRVKDINSGGDAYPAALTVVVNTLYFSADDGSSGRELWKSDGSANGTLRVKDINPGMAGSEPQDIVAIQPDGRALFIADDGTHGIELWQTDGTAPGTAMVQDLAPGAQSSAPYHREGTHGHFFGAYIPTIGAELYTLDTANLHYTTYVALMAR